MKIAWSQEYSVGVEELDRQHKQFIDTLNSLSDALYAKEQKDRLVEIFRQLVVYSTDHFATEEKYFTLCAYAGAAEHIAEHQKFTAMIIEYRSQLEKDTLPLSFALIDYLEDWLVNHLYTMDKQYSECLKACDVTKEDKRLDIST